MDSTSRKEHHIINVLGWCGGEEKCRMSPPDREKTLRLFISGHLPQTAFSPFAFDTPQKAQRMEKAAGWREQHPHCPCSPSHPPHPFLTSPERHLSTLHQCHNCDQEPARLQHCNQALGSHQALPCPTAATGPPMAGPILDLSTQDQSIKDVWRLSVITGYQIPASSTARASLPQGQPPGATLPSIPWLQPLPYL